MRRIASFFFILAGTALLLIASSSYLVYVITEKRKTLNGPFGIHHSDAGDLVSMGYLDNVERFKESFAYYFAKPSDTARQRNIDLYIYGDSYLRMVPDTAFGSINAYHYAWRSVADLKYTLNPHKKNILIIEYAERFARGEFHNLDIYQHVKKDTPVSAFRWSPDSQVFYAKFLTMQFFDPLVNRNLEFNVFGYRFWDNFKFAKASLTYTLFKRAVGDVVVSEDGSRLFLRMTMAPNDLLSSYKPFDQKELNEMIANINAVYDHYKAEGFDEVYLSIIPNPVSIIQPLHYNGLIPQLQKPGVLNGTKIIDVFTPFSQAADPGSMYRIGDTHWNNNGLQEWLKIVNAELKRQGTLADSGNQAGSGKP